ncbi:MAG: DUF5671 domain-containing protein [bacterium]|nr:DUF5671 domain-containing protein [bacterium]
MTETIKTSPKDVFLHLLSILWLYVSIGSFGNLIFQIINFKFPDALSYENAAYISESLKFPLSILVVSFPLFFTFSYYVQKDVVTNPEKRELRVRKWLIYFTLSLAAVVIAGDIISLIYTYLNGEITTRFILKVLAVLGIAVSVFIYYVWYLREETMAIKNPKMRAFIYGVVLLVLGFIVAGFILAGSPQSARLRRFDDRRIADLQNIQYQILYYFQVKQKLPESISILRDVTSGFIPPNDPETNVSYEYIIDSKNAFKLCATFSAEDQSQTSNETSVMPVPVGGKFEINDVWTHSAGRVCFDRPFDPDKYRPIVNQPVPVKY